MHTRLALAAVLGIAACGGGGSGNDSITIQSITPAFGPLSGGTRVIITGSGFLRDGAPPNHVVIGDTEAPLAAASDDQTLEVEIPPGTKAGDVSVTIFNRNGTSSSAMGMFHYSTEPTITGVAPGEVLYNGGGTITLNGTGFMDENAGPATVTINGQLQVDVMVKSDTQLSFLAQPGPALARPDVQIVNNRGTALKKAAFRYAPSTNPCFLIFTNNDATNYMYIFDPTANTTTAVRNLRGTPSGYRAIFQDMNGDYWAIGNRFSGDNKFGKIDFTTQDFISPITLSGRINSLARQGSTVYAIDRNSGALGTLDIKTGTFLQVGATNSTPCCTEGLAASASTVYYVNGSGVSTINPANGQRGTTTALNPAKHTDDLKVLGTTVYGVTTTGEVFSVDPTTGVTTTVVNLGFGVRSISTFDVYTPGMVQ